MRKPRTPAPIPPYVKDGLVTCINCGKTFPYVPQPGRRRCCSAACSKARSEASKRDSHARRVETLRAAAVGLTVLPAHTRATMSSNRLGGQAFIGYLRTRAGHNHADAIAVLGYASPASETYGQVARDIGLALVAGRFDSARYRELLERLDALAVGYAAGPKTVDDRDPKDWQRSGGGIMRRNHSEPDANDYERAQYRAATASVPEE